LFRHGDRTIDRSIQESYPNDPYKDKDFYPHGDGQLTNVRSDLHVIVDTFTILLLLRLSLVTLIFKYYFCKYVMHYDFYR